MRCLRLAFTFLLISACFHITVLSAADVEVKQNPVPANSFAVCKYKLDKGDSVQWIIVPEPNEIEEFNTDAYAQCHFNGDAKKYVTYALITNFDTKKQSKKRVEVVMGKAPQPPPKPDDPVDPIVPVDPDKPIDVKTFRVIFITNPTATLTSGQYNAINAKMISDFLNSACTKSGELADWRRWGVAQKVDNDTATMKALWSAIQPQIKATDPPCVAIEVNGKVEIIPLAVSPEVQLDTLKKYRGVK